MSLVVGTEVSMSHIVSLLRPLVSCLLFKRESPVSAPAALSAATFPCHNGLLSSWNWKPNKPLLL